MLQKPLPLPVLVQEVAPASIRPASGVKLLGAPTRDDAFIECLLRQRMAQVDDLMSAVEDMSDPHVSTEMHRLCASVVQVVLFLQVTPPVQTMPILRDLDLG